MSEHDVDEYVWIDGNDDGSNRTQVMLLEFDALLRTYTISQGRSVSIALVKISRGDALSIIAADSE